MNNIKRLLAAAAASAMLAACSQGNSAPPAVNTVNPGNSSYSKLQLAVGTANIAGLATGLNVVSTLRQPNGKSAVLLSTPVLTGKFDFSGFAALCGSAGVAAGAIDAYSTIASGVPAGKCSEAPSMQDIANNQLTGTSQTVHPGAPACDTNSPIAAPFVQCTGGVTPNTTTFGQSGSVFAMGFQPANSTTNGVPYTYTPYSVPLFATCGTPTAPNTNGCVQPATGGTGIDRFVPWGGPPAFDPNGDGMGFRDGSFDLGNLQGVNMGITVFQLPQTLASLAGAYSLNATIPTGLNNQGQSSFATVTANATLTSATELPTVTAPTLNEDGNGGGTFTGVTLPAGATEGYIQVVDLGPAFAAGAPGNPNCQGVLGTSAFPVYYTIVVKPGTTTYTLPDTDGPNTTQGGPSTKTPSMTLCTASANNTATKGAQTVGDTYSVQFIAVDYPLFEATPPANTQQTPTITGASGQSDITISAPITKAAGY